MYDHLAVISYVSLRKATTNVFNRYEDCAFDQYKVCRYVCMQCIRNRTQMSTGTLCIFAYMSRRVVWEHRVPINVCFRRSRAGLAGVVIVVGNGVTLSGGIIPETRKRRRENRKPVEKKKTSTLVQRKKIKMGQFCLYSLLIIWCHTYSLTPGAET